MVATAERNIRVQEREERRQRIATEQARLDSIKIAAKNTRRIKELAVQKARRVATAVANAPTATFMIQDGDLIHRIKVRFGHEDAGIRAFARGAINGLVAVLLSIEVDRMVCAAQGIPGPDVQKRLNLTLDGDSVR